MKETVCLDQWIDESGLTDFAEKHLRVHLEESLSISKEMLEMRRQNPVSNEFDATIRCIMISLRQELEQNGWRKVK